MPTPDFNDLEEDLDTVPPPIPKPTFIQAQAEFAQRATPTQITCPSCRGSGRFISWSGREVGECFKCNGTGRCNAPRQLKMTPEAIAQRAKDKQYRANKKAQIAAQEAAEQAAWLAAHTDVTTWVEANSGHFDFATSLGNSLRQYGTLTENQVAAVRRCIVKENERKAAIALVPKNPAGLDLSSVPSGCYAVPGGDTRLKVKIDNVTDEGKWKGWVFVKDAAVYGEGKRYGSQRPNQNYKGDIEDVLRVIAANPAEASMAYGKLVGCCGVCGRPLENADSVARGIGPICAGKMGW